MIETVLEHPPPQKKKIQKTKQKNQKPSGSSKYRWEPS